MKWWSTDRKAKKRILASFPIYSRLDEFEIQIRFEAWVRKYPHIEELYDSNKLIITIDKQDNFNIGLKMTDTQYTMWCLKYPETPIGQTFSLHDL